MKLLIFFALFLLFVAINAKPDFVVNHSGGMMMMPNDMYMARARMMAFPKYGYPMWAPGSGMEGQWMPDNNEAMYDNGQYHGEMYS